MPLTLPISNFSKWKKSSAAYFYPANDATGDNHIHVTCEKIDENKKEVTVKAVSIKVQGKNTNLRVGSAVTAFKFSPTTDTKFPPDPLGDEYKKVLAAAGLTKPFAKSSAT